MKKFTRILSIILCLVLIAPSSLAATKMKGVTLDKFQKYLSQSAKKYFDYKKTPVIEAEYESTVEENRNALNIKAATTTAFAVTYEDSDILEYAGFYSRLGSADGAASNYLLAFLFSVVDNKDAKKREKRASEIISSFSSSITFDENMNAYGSAINDQYITYVLSSEIGTLYAHKHKDSVMTVEELLDACNDRLISESTIKPHEEVMSEKGTVTLSTGKYDCPKHIPAGEYKVTPQKSGNLFVTRNGKTIVNEILRPADGDEIGRLVLEDGDTIEIASGGKFDFEPIQ